MPEVSQKDWELYQAWVKEGSVWRKQKLDLQKLDKKVKELQNAADAKEKDDVVKDQEFKELERQLVETKQRVRDLDEKAKSDVAGRESAEKDNEEKSKYAEEAGRKMEKAQNDHKELKQKFQGLVGDLQRLDLEARRKSDDYWKLKEEYDEMSVDVDELKAYLRASQNDVEKLTGKVNSLEGHQKRLQDLEVVLQEQFGSHFSDEVRKLDVPNVAKEISVAVQLNYAGEMTSPGSPDSTRPSRPSAGKRVKSIAEEIQDAGEDTDSTGQKSPETQSKRNSAVDPIPSDTARAQEKGQPKAWELGLLGKLPDKVYQGSDAGSQVGVDTSKDPDAPSAPPSETGQPTALPEEQKTAVDAIATSQEEATTPKSYVPRSTPLQDGEQQGTTESASTPEEEAATAKSPVPRPIIAAPPKRKNKQTTTQFNAVPNTIRPVRRTAAKHIIIPYTEKLSKPGLDLLLPYGLWIILSLLLAAAMVLAWQGYAERKVWLLANEVTRQAFIRFKEQGSGWALFPPTWIFSAERMLGVESIMLG